MSYFVLAEKEFSFISIFSKGRKIRAILSRRIKGFVFILFGSGLVLLALPSVAGGEQAFLGLAGALLLGLTLILNSNEESKIRQKTQN